MNGNEELRDRLRRLDPLHPDVAIEPPDAPEARTKLEHIMSMTSTEPTQRSSTRPKLMTLAAAAVVVVAAVAAVVAFTGGSGEDEPQAAPLQLNTGDGGVLASCIELTPETLGAVPVAFGGTVTAIDGDVVTLDVDRWYKGGDAETVQVTARQGLEALIGTIDFVVGQRYLVSAYDDVVDLCGFSGPATPELEGLYEQAFAG